MHETVVPLGVDQVQRIGIGDVLVVISRVDLVGDQEFGVVERVRMRVEMPARAVPVMDVLSVIGQEMPSRLGTAFDEYVRRDIRNRKSTLLVPLRGIARKSRGHCDTLPTKDR